MSGPRRQMQKGDRSALENHPRRPTERLRLCKPDFPDPDANLVDYRVDTVEPGTDSLHLE